MASKVMLDVNILLDFTLKREQYADAKSIMKLIVAGRINAFITPAMVHITGYWLTKYYGASKAKKILLALLVDVKVIDINHEITLHALNSKMKDIEDALQYYTALSHKIEVFVSRDKGLRKEAIPELPVYTPKEFLNEFLE